MDIDKPEKKKPADIHRYAGRVRARSGIDFDFEEHDEMELVPMVVEHRGETWYMEFLKNGTYRKRKTVDSGNGDVIWFNPIGGAIDMYFSGFGCAAWGITNREEALARLDRKPRPLSRALYLSDIEKRWPS